MKYPAFCARTIRGSRKNLAKWRRVCYNASMETRIVAFDIGDRRVGVAYSDPFGSYAVPGETYFRVGNFSEDVKAVAAIARERGAQVIVCGLPVNADGTESVQTEKTRRFIDALEKEADVPVVCEDERYTTLEARRDLAASGISAKKDKRKKAVDSLAATYILEGYLAKSKRRQDMKGEMKEENNDYEDDNIIELIDDDGNTFRFEHLMTFEYKNEWYVALTQVKEAEEAEAEDDEEGEEVAIYHIVGEGEDEHLETIEDDALLDEVFAEFTAQYEDFEDADEAASLEPDEE